MNALLEKDPYSVADRMAQLKRAIDSIQGADVLVLQAETEALIATQTLIADVASGFPIIGETIDASSLIEGSTPAGEQLDAWGKAFALLGLIPVAGDLLQVVRRSPDTIRAMSQMVVGIDNASEESLNAIARVARLDVQTLRQTSGRLAQIQKCGLPREVLESMLLPREQTARLRRPSVTLILLAPMHYGKRLKKMPNRR